MIRANRSLSPKRPLIVLLLVSLLLIVLNTTALAENSNRDKLNQGAEGISLNNLFPGATFDESVPTQVEVTGVEPGERPLRPDEVLRFFQALADASPLAELRQFGATFENRPLVYLAISEAATVAELDNFREGHHDLLDPRTGDKTSAESLQGTKAVAWFAYGIHGDELSSTDAAASMAYWLVAGTDENAIALRKNLMILIDPCENPDGRTRYLAQTLSFAHRVANGDSDDLSHRTVWPWGRGNHYLFDMNRDWFSLILPESARSVEIARWVPQMLVDSHEMGANSSYLFSPPRHPFNPHLPANVRKWEQPVADAQARALDERGYPYFTGEWNEEFFPGYGSSWISYQGAIGILYEMSRTSGTLVRKHNGTVRTFAQAVEHQVTSSLSNLTFLSEHAAEILADQISSRAEAVASGSKAMVAAWVFPVNSRHPQRVVKFAEGLQKQGLEVQTLGGQKTISVSLTDSRTGEKTKVDLAPGSLLVSMAQPAANLARVLLDPHVPMDATFLREEREYLEKGKGSRLYDTTAWSLPLMRGVEAYWSGGLPKGAWQGWQAPGEMMRAAVQVPEAPYYVLDGDVDTAPEQLAFLLQAGLTVRVAEKPFTMAGRQFNRGSLVLQREGNQENLTAMMQQLSDQFHFLPLAVGTADPAAGPALGGSHFDVLVAPRVGVLTGMPVSPTDYGFVWHLLDQDLKLRFSALDIGGFGRVDLSRYNVLIFPPIFGGTGMYRQILGESGLDRLCAWVKAGGTAIGLAGGARLLADPEVELTKTRFRNQVVQQYPSPVWSISALEVDGAGRPSAVGVRVKAKSDDKDAPMMPKIERDNSYDVAPVLGAGARPFVKDVEQGTALGGEPMSMAQWAKPVLRAGQKNLADEDRTRIDARLRQFMPQGSLLRVQLTPEVWLNYGLPAEIAILFGGDDPLIASAPVTVAAKFDDIDQLHLGGLLWPEAAARLANTAFATREQVGRGQVILFADHPGFRRWMVESERMLKNAILMGPGLGTRWSTPW